MPVKKKAKAKPKAKLKKQAIKHTKGKLSMSWSRFEVVTGSSLRRIHIWGPPGIGKTFISQFIARSGSKQEPFQVTLNEDLTIQEIGLGHYVPMGDHFEWHDGPIASAMRHGIPLIINELGRASGAVQDMLLAVLDDPKVASIALPNGERLKPKEGFRVFATSNTSLDDVDEALRDRFDVSIHVTEPHPELVKALNESQAGMGDWVFDSYKDPKRAISPRRAFTFIALLKHCQAEMAAQIVFEQNHADVLMTLRSRRVIGA